VDFPAKYKEDLPKSLQEEIDQLKDRKYDAEAVTEIAKKASKKLDRKVSTRIEKGEAADTIAVVFEVEHRSYRPKLATDRTDLVTYNSLLGWNGGIEVDLINGPTDLTIGFRNTGDRKLEREAGLLGAFGTRIVTDRLAFRFEWENLRAQWNHSTLAALEQQNAITDLYRRHDILAPMLGVRVAGPLTISVGAEMNRLQFQYPKPEVRWANALFGEAKVDQRWRSGVLRQRFQADYRLTNATKQLESDLTYIRHFGSAQYSLRAGKEEFRAKFQAGAVSPAAPIYARFALGNTVTLRGWSMFDVAPVGGDRMQYASLEYRHDWLWSWYDTGTVYDRGKNSHWRHAAGVGIRASHDFEFGVGFPLRSGSMSPVFFVRVGF
jgi:hypothetical protein